LRTSSNGDELQFVQYAQANRTAERPSPVSKRRQEYRGGKSESGPCGESTPVTGANKSKREPDLTAGGPGKKLTERDEIRVFRIVDPAAADHNFLREVADMSNWTAKGRQPKLEEGE
jgi:hypothetical protein